MRVIEDRCPFSDVAMAKTKRRNARKSSVVTNKQQNTHNSDERDSGKPGIHYMTADGVPIRCACGKIVRCS